jgi:hypothetical protein
VSLHTWDFKVHNRFEDMKKARERLDELRLALKCASERVEDGVLGHAERCRVAEEYTKAYDGYRTAVDDYAKMLQRRADAYKAGEDQPA